MTTVLTVAGLDLGLDQKINYMRWVCKSYPTTNGRTQVQVPIKSTLDPTGKGSIAADADSLNSVIAETVGEKVVLGYSRGAQVAGAWIRKYAHRADAPPAKDLSFILIGNPERLYGQPPWVKSYTPNWSQYAVVDVARQDDGWCNWDGSLRRRIGMLGAVHLQYWGVDPFGGPVAPVRVVQNTAYVVVR